MFVRSETIQKKIEKVGGKWVMKGCRDKWNLINHYMEKLQRKDNVLIMDQRQLYHCDIDQIVVKR